jgi:hypothetical protein
MGLQAVDSIFGVWDDNRDDKLSFDEFKEGWTNHPDVFPETQ